MASSTVFSSLKRAGRLALACGLLAACGGENPDPASRAVTETTVYRHGMSGTPTSLDPAHASSVYAAPVVLNLFDTLYRYRYLARPYELTPNLAAAMPEVSEDGLEYTIRIKPGVRFADDEAFEGGAGREVTAADVVYSLKRHFHPETRSQGAWLWQGRLAGLDAWAEAGADPDQEVEGLRATGKHELTVRLTRPYPQLTHTLAHALSAIVPREAVEHHGRAFGAKPVGSGPYRLLSMDSARAVLERNPNYLSEPFDPAAEGAGPDTDPRILELAGRSPPFADRVEVEFIPEDAARWNALVSGAVDFIRVPVQQFSEVLASRDPPRLADKYRDRFRMRAGREAGFVHLDFNMADPEIGHADDPQRDARNRALRCAIVAAFDWDARNQAFYDGIGEVFPGIIPPAAPEFDPDVQPGYTEHRPQHARDLLADAGWTAEELPALEYGFASSVTERQMFEQFRSFLVDVGWPQEKVQPLAFPSYGEFARAYSNGEVMLMHYSWTMDYPDAENTVQLFYGPNAAPGSNAASFRDAEFDRLFEQSQTLQASPERTELFQRMNRRVMDECATISGLSRTLVMMWNRRVAIRPDISFVGGFAWRFAAVEPGASP